MSRFRTPYERALARALAKGRDARKAGEPITANPYTRFESKASWRIGWQTQDGEMNSDDAASPGVVDRATEARLPYREDESE